MAPSISPERANAFHAYIDDATKSDKPALPGVLLHIGDSKGNTIFSHVSGNSGQLSENSIGRIHSVTKIIGAITFMQLVDRGLATLDDPSVIQTNLPELWNKKVLTGFEEDGKTPILVDRTGEITPRMLMNHTNGTGHTYFNEVMLKYLAKGWESRNEIADPYQTILDAPLMWQPGTHTNYGTGLDWLAVLVERFTKQNLATYLDENIFKPLGLKSIGFDETYGGDVITRSVNEGLFWPRNLKQPDGTYIAMDPVPLAKVERPTRFPEGTYHGYPLGDGLVASPKEIARILSILLPSNAGTDPITGSKILSPESVKAITSPCLPEAIRNDSRYVPSAFPLLLIPSDLEAPHMDPDGSYGLGCAVQGADRKLKDGRRGRSKGSVYWYGAANADFWVDGEKGMVVVMLGNYLPWNDEAWVDFVAGVEGRLYEGLEG